MGEKRSNHTVYNVNYHFVWCPKYRHPILGVIEDSLESIFREVCDKTTRYCRCTSHPTTYTCSCRHIPNTLRARLYGQSRVLQHERCGNNTNSCYKNTCGVVGSGKNRTTWGRLVTFRPIRLNSTSSERNTFNRAYGLHPRGQAPRHSACSACRICPDPRAVTFCRQLLPDLQRALGGETHKTCIPGSVTPISRSEAVSLFGPVSAPTPLSRNADSGGPTRSVSTRNASWP
jgi:hypothetical protein